VASARFSPHGGIEPQVDRAREHRAEACHMKTLTAEEAVRMVRPFFDYAEQSRARISHTNRQRPMHKMFVALALAVLASTAAAGSERRDVIAVVRQWTSVFSMGNSRNALAACADETSIIDDIPPHEWHGDGACAKWMNDLNAYLKSTKLSDVTCVLSKPWHIDITADRAYVVVPVNFTYKQSGKDMKALGSLLTVALRKDAAGWRIIGWAIAAR
jgi:hypothetical protein